MASKVYLTAVRVINCQSMADVTINFLPEKLNVFVADNSTGKSIFYKLLMITACPKKFNREDRNNLIRRGSPFAQIIYQFSDGSYGAVRIYPERVIYYFTESAKQKMSQSLLPDQRLLERLSLIIDGKSEFVANIIDMDQNLLFVDSNTKSNSNILTMLTTDEMLEKLTEQVNLKLTDYSAYKVRIEDQLNSVNDKIKNYKYVDVQSLERSLEDSENLLNITDKLFSITRGIEIANSKIHSSVDFNQLLFAVDIASKLDGIHSAALSFRAPTNYQDRWLQIVMLLRKLEELQVDLKKLHVSDYDEDSMLEVGMLEKFSLAKRSLEIYKQPIQISLDDETASSICCKLDDIIAALKTIPIQEIQDINKKLNEYYHELQENGEIVPCKLFGEVIFNGQKCIPVNQ